MKKLILLTMLIVSYFSPAQSCNIGNQTSNSNFTATSYAPNYLLGVKFTLSQPGTLNSINMLSNGNGDNVQMAVYNDNAGKPNNLVAASSPGIVAAGLTSFPVAPVPLLAGDYWIMAVYKTGGNPCNANLNAVGNDVYYTDLIFGNPIPNNAAGFVTYTGHDLLYFLGITCGILATETGSLQTAKVYPNPSSDYITISTTANAQKYVIVNSVGQVLLKGNGSMKNINIKNLSNGVYFIKIDQQNPIKFIKK